jgi:hypothetical protein
MAMQENMALANKQRTADSGISAYKPNVGEKVAGKSNVKSQVKETNTVEHHHAVQVRAASQCTSAENWYWRCYAKFKRKGQEGENVRNAPKRDVTYTVRVKANVHVNADNARQTSVFAPRTARMREEWGKIT